MAPGENDWTEYRLMILDWHEQDIKEKREIRNRLEAHETMVMQQLTAIQTTLAEMRGARKAKELALGILVPATVALAIFGGEAAIAALLK